VQSGFFFQAEDGIRDFHVTGVQTCALPILRLLPAAPSMKHGIAPCRTSRSPGRSLTFSTGVLPSTSWAAAQTEGWGRGLRISGPKGLAVPGVIRVLRKNPLKGKMLVPWLITWE